MGLRQLLRPIQPKRSAIPYLVLLSALLLTGLATYYVELSARAQDRLRFNHSVQRTQVNIEERLNTYIALLRAGRGLFDVEGQVSAAEFKAFTQPLELATQYPGIQGIGFSARLSAAEVVGATARPRLDGNPVIPIRPDFSRDDYHAIVYLEPPDRRNQAALGYDMSTEAVRRTAMEWARDTGEPTASGRVTLVQEIDREKQAGFLIYLPIYEGGAVPTRLSARRQRLRGYVYSPFRVDDLIRGSLYKRPTQYADFEIYDGLEVGPENLLHRSTGTSGRRRAAAQPRLRETAVMSVAGRPWTFVFTSNSALDAVSERRLVPFIAAVGTAVSLVLFGLTRSQVRARLAAERSTERLQESETALLKANEQLNSILNRITDGFVAFDPEFRFTYLNRASLELMKKAPDALLGKTQWEAYPTLRGTQLEQQYRRAMAEQVPTEFEQYIEPLNLWAEVRAFPSPSGLSIYWRDISDRKEAEAERVRVEAERQRAENVLKEREASFQAFVANVPGMVFRYVPFAEGGGRFTFVSSGVRKLLELEPDALMADPNTFFSSIHPNDWPSFKATVTHAVKHFLYWRWEGRVITPSGQLKWIQGRSSAVETAQGAVWDGLFIDVTERKQAEQELEQSNQTLATLIDASPLPIVVIALDCTVRLWNPAATALFGWAEAEVLDKPLPVVPAEKQDECRQLRRAVEQGETIYGAKTYRYRRDGSRVEVEVSAAPLCDESGQVVEIVLIWQDVTERLQAETERERLLQLERVAREEAETANRIKDEFLAVLSHELRSPLNPILGWAKLLQERRLSEETSRQGLLTIERNAKLQTQLIEDLLDISRILRGKMALHIGPVNLVQIIEAALETVQLAADAKKLRITQKLDPQAASVLGDGARLQQVVWNLLSNAVKFTPAGGQVEVSLECAGPFAVIQVQDNGVGISPQFLPHVFDYFRQEDGKTTRRFGGLGLGLAIARHLTELHGGTVAVVSAGADQGATFTVKIPLAPTPQPEPSSPRTPRQIDLSRLHILVVDDEVDMRDLLQTVLRRYGAQVSAAASATEALALLEQRRPDLIISDIGMPDMDGYALIRHIRRQAETNDGLQATLPAIALTAYAAEADQQQALEAGFQQHLSKPIEPEVLAQAIVKIMARA